jgi:hypothetical protein
LVEGVDIQKKGEEAQPAIDDHPHPEESQDRLIGDYNYLSAKGNAHNALPGSTHRSSM